jgi:hypothetical protein
MVGIGLKWVKISYCYFRMAPGLRSQNKKRTMQQTQPNVQSEQLSTVLEQNLSNESTLQAAQPLMNNNSNGKKL